jgi:cyclophilin family peptidyl-prolyl cis-trans isomerase
MSITRKIIACILMIAILGIAVGCGGKTLKWNSPPAMAINADHLYTATIKTNYGDIVIELFPKESPLTVNNFVFLARQGFYDGVKFHRVVKGFVIQTGDPTGTGRGGPGYQFNDELPVQREYGPGIIAMANSGSNTNGSQFFICTGTKSKNLNMMPNYNIFGKVTSGMDVALKIDAVPVTGSEPSSPTVDVHIDKVVIEEKAAS